MVHKKINVIHKTVWTKKFKRLKLFDYCTECLETLFKITNSTLKNWSKRNDCKMFWHLGRYNYMYIVYIVIIIVIRALIHTSVMFLTNRPFKCHKGHLSKKKPCDSSWTKNTHCMNKSKHSRSSLGLSQDVAWCDQHVFRVLYTKKELTWH